MSDHNMPANKNSDHLFQLMIEKLTGDINTPEERELDHLIETDAAVKKMWQHLQDRFSEEDVKNQLARFDVDQYWEDLSFQPVPKQRHLFIKRMAWAAAVLAGISIGGYLLFTKPGKVNTPSPSPQNAVVSVQLQLPNGKIIDLSASQGAVKAGDATLLSAPKSLSYTKGAGPDNEATAGINILKVPAGLDYKVALSDGTEIWLNSATELRFPFRFQGGAREISVNGEAFLKVAGNPRQPFIVHTPHSVIQVIGTQFNINTYDSGLVKVALVEGAVKLHAGQQARRISPGQEAVYTQANNSIHVAPFDQEHVLSWREGVHYFDNATIEEISSVFPRWYGLSIKMDNHVVAQKRFSGVLNRNRPVEEFMKALKATTELDYYFDREGILHLK
jgi:hypothetical protein